MILKGVRTYSEQLKNKFLTHLRSNFSPDFLVHLCSDYDSGQLIEDQDGFSSVYASWPENLLFRKDITKSNKRGRALICLTIFESTFKHPSTP